MISASVNSFIVAYSLQRRVSWDARIRIVLPVAEGDKLSCLGRLGLPEVARQAHVEFDAVGQLAADALLVRVLLEYRGFRLVPDLHLEDVGRSPGLVGGPRVDRHQPLAPALQNAQE